VVAAFHVCHQAGLSFLNLPDAFGIARQGGDCILTAGAIHAVRATANPKPVVHFVSSIEGDSFQPGRGNDTRLYALLDDEVPRLAN